MSKMPDAKVLAKIAELANIRNLPANRQIFESRIEAGIEVAHVGAAFVFIGARKLKTAKKIGRLARELKRTLETSDKEHLAQFLRLPVDSYIAPLNDLVEEAQWIERLNRAKRKGKAAEVARKQFVKNLLDAADRAGGRLRLNTRTEGGSLVVAMKLLEPYLPAEFGRKLSLATLRRIYEPWLKNAKNSSKNLKFESTSTRH
jgi:hypothetical protein